MVYKTESIKFNQGFCQHAQAFDPCRFFSNQLFFSCFSQHFTKLHHIVYNIFAYSISYLHNLCSNIYNIVLILTQPSFSMNEILNLNNQRANDIQQINHIFQQESKHKHTKTYFQDRQRMRQQKQNWLISTLKKNKSFTPQQKKQICSVTVQIMNFMNFHIEKNNKQIQNKIDFPEVDLENNFIQTIINIFVDFINLDPDSLSSASIKSIVRPNNNYVVMDLIKLLIDYCRNKLKQALKRNSKYFNQYGTQVSKISNLRQKSKSVRYTQGNQLPQEDFQFGQVFSQQIIPERGVKISTTVNIVTSVPSKKQSLKNLNLNPNISINSHTQTICFRQSNFIQNNIKQHLIQKNKRFLDQINLQKIQQKMNSLFIELVQLNEVNQSQINQYYETTLGKKSKFNYDGRGLYSQKEKIQRKVVIGERLNQLQNEALPNQMSSELQFREYSKKYIESCVLSEQLFKLEKKNIQPLTQWILLKSQYTNLRFQPITLLIIDGDQAYPWRKYRKHIPIKQFLRQKLKKCIQTKQIDNQTNTKQKISKKFRKQLFLDINKKKVNELLLMNHKIISKKQSLFPILRNTLQRQKNQGQSFQERKPGSQTVIKNGIIQKNSYLQREKNDRKLSELPKKFEKLPTSSGKKIASNNIYSIHKICNIENDF